jgi:hypothetical protein
MYIDYDARLSDKQDLTNASSTVSSTSTYYLDTLQAGWGANDEVYARFQVGTAFAGTAASSLTIAIQIAQDTAFSTVLTAATTTISTVAKLPKNNIPFVVKLPVAMMTGQTQGDSLYTNSATSGNLPYRYVRATYQVTGTGCALTAGTISCMLVMNPPVTIDRPM